MYGHRALGVTPHTEGVVLSGVYYNRATSVVAGGNGTVAGPGGASIGRFGWVGADGRVFNARQSAADVLGVVAVQYGDWRRIFYDEPSNTWKIREGVNLTLIAGALGMWVRFPAGAVWNARVYANPVDGTPFSGQTPGYEVTPWAVGRSFGPGGLSLITTWNN